LTMHSEPNVQMPPPLTSSTPLQGTSQWKQGASSESHTSQSATRKSTDRSSQPRTPPPPALPIKRQKFGGREPEGGSAVNRRSETSNILDVVVESRSTSAFVGPDSTGISYKCGDPTPHADSALPQSKSNSQSPAANTILNHPSDRPPPHRALAVQKKTETTKPINQDKGGKRNFGGLQAGGGDGPKESNLATQSPHLSARSSPQSLVGRCSYSAAPRQASTAVHNKGAARAAEAGSGCSSAVDAKAPSSGGMHANEGENGVGGVGREGEQDVIGRGALSKERAAPANLISRIDVTRMDGTFTTNFMSQ
jgi:hypothetical protein